MDVEITKLPVQRHCCIKVISIVSKKAVIKIIIYGTTGPLLDNKKNDIIVVYLWQSIISHDK